MRLTNNQKDMIQACVSDTLTAFQDARVFVFGSRLNDTARGGDVDLMVETTEPVPLLVKARLKKRLEERLNLPVDVVFRCAQDADNAFQAIARLQAKPLMESEASRK